MTRRRHYHLPFCYFATVSLVVGRSTAAYYSSTVFVAGQQAASRSSTIGLSASSTATNSAAAAACHAPDVDQLPLDLPRRTDVLVALAAVRQAGQVARELQPSSSTSFTNQNNNNNIETIQKWDTSPVTVADFAVQAMVLYHLKEAFKLNANHDSFIAEESSQALDQNDTLAELVTNATTNILYNADLVKRSIDLGKEYELWNDSENKRPSRVWCLDPIDGTKGFLRGRREGGQYCVALALLEEGIPTIGIMACPNLPSRPDDFNYAWKNDETQENNEGTRGCIFVATKGGGCYQLPFVPGSHPPVPLVVTPNDGSTMATSDARFCIGVERFSDALGQCAGIAKLLHGAEGVTAEGEIINARKFDSMAKYGVLARAGAEFYVRLPKPGYLEWIWDHAAGHVVITEAGGKMTDTNGDEVDFSLGAKMSDKVKGVLASNGGIFHDALVAAFQEQEVERLKQLSDAEQ